MESRSRSIPLLGAAFVLCPWAWGKIVIATMAAGLLSHWSTRRGRLSRRSVAIAAGLALWVAHVASPYWLLAPSVSTRIGALSALVVLVLVWTRVAAADMKWRSRSVPLPVSLGVAVTIALLCAPGLGAPLEFRGDEDVHVARPLAALEAMQGMTARHASVVSMLLATIIVVLALRPWLTTPVLAVAVLTFPALIAWRFLGQPPEVELLAKLGRYPILSAWLHTAAAFSPFQMWPARRQLIYDEALFRIVPLLAGLGLAGWLLRVLKGSPLQRGLGALALATAPVVLHYATALYLELAAVVFATVGMYGLDVTAGRVLRGEPDRRGALLALSLGLLLKESLVPLGLAAVALCAWWALTASGRARTRLVGWTRLAFVILTPIGIYLIWRLGSPTLASLRRAQLDLSPLGNAELYTRLPGALWTSMGPLLLLTIAGAIVSIRRRPRAAVLWLTALLGTFVLMAGDTVRETAHGPLPAYWGHSRMLLLAFPPVCCFAIEGLRALSRGQIGLTISAAIVIANAWLRPIGWDGSRPPYWGDMVVETAGERYPYPALYRRLATSGVTGDVVIIGRDYPYRDDFYLKRYSLDVGLRPVPAYAPRGADLRDGLGTDAATRELLRQLEEHSREPAPIVVAHPRVGVDPASLPLQVGPLGREQIFRLGAASLILYRARPR
jgi:hypothetical protein